MFFGLTYYLIIMFHSVAVYISHRITIFVTLYVKKTLYFAQVLNKNVLFCYVEYYIRRYQTIDLNGHQLYVIPLLFKFLSSFTVCYKVGHGFFYCINLGHVCITATRK